MHQARGLWLSARLALSSPPCPAVHSLLARVWMGRVWDDYLVLGHALLLPCHNRLLLQAILLFPLGVSRKASSIERLLLERVCDPTLWFGDEELRLPCDKNEFLFWWFFIAFTWCDCMVSLGVIACVFCKGACERWVVSRHVVVWIHLRRLGICLKGRRGWWWCVCVLWLIYDKVCWRWYKYEGMTKTLRLLYVKT